MGFLSSLRKLLLGETRILPAGVALAVTAAAVVRVLAGPGGWWRPAGGAILLAGLVVALAASLPRR